MKKKHIPATILFALSLSLYSCEDNRTDANDGVLDPNTTDPMELPQTDTNQVPGTPGTRSDYQPSTGPGGQTDAERNETTPAPQGN